ncbi:MAG TPA: SIMPL domain-containing protein [Pyrinomonadaceae bacterium]|nr:SIMPL domain-containing protein [Pyrinomonadaceae bacterium]
MKKTLLALLIALTCAAATIAQEAGNRQYGGGTNRRASPSNGVIFGSENKDLVPAQYIEAYVLINSAPDEFVAMFGVAQEAPTAAASNAKVNAQLDQFLKAVTALGVSRTDTFVDFITQNRVYTFVPGTSSSIIQETLTGFETKKTISIRYKDRTLLEKLLTAAAAASIFDLIKVDYIISDTTKIRNRLFEEASRVIKQKEESYSRTLGLKLRRDAIYQEKYDTHYPAELYESYKAFESGAVESPYESRTQVVRARKSSTSYLEPLDRSAFDSVLTPIGIEPVVQSTLFLKVRYGLAQ